jgi:hypothetical protein
MVSFFHFASEALVCFCVIREAILRAFTFAPIRSINRYVKKLSSRVLKVVVRQLCKQFSTQCSLTRLAWSSEG